ncbi:MAG: thioesterase family protein [Gammaproteobacteria bacterium]|nr:thioesterase family protein [Gammaproteobacteria bacterium]
MKETCRPGLQKSRRITVDHARATRHLGDESGVYATPALVGDIESLCRDLLLEHLDAGEDSVGTRVDIQHLAPTPEGMWVDITATVSAIDRRAFTFDVVARDVVEEVGRCTHSRFVIESAKLKERLATKVARGRGA